MHDVPAAAVAAARMIEAGAGTPPARVPAPQHELRTRTKPCPGRQLLCSPWRSGRGNRCSPWLLIGPRSWPPPHSPERVPGSTMGTDSQALWGSCAGRGRLVPDGRRVYLASGVRPQLPKPQNPVQACAGAALAMERWVRVGRGTAALSRRPGSAMQAARNVGAGKGPGVSRVNWLTPAAALKLRRCAGRAGGGRARRAGPMAVRPDTRWHCRSGSSGLRPLRRHGRAHGRCAGPQDGRHAALHSG